MGNNFWDTLKGTVLNKEVDWLKDLYGKSKAEQQSAIKEVFTVVSDGNLDEVQLSEISAKATSLEASVERLEAKMVTLQEQIASKQDYHQTPQ